MQSAHSEVRDTLARYLKYFPCEFGRFELLREQLASGEDIFARSNMTGHVTTSAAVLNPAGNKILLIDHAFLKKWLPPGGHFELPGGLWDSANREVGEETGVLDAILHAWSHLHSIPLDIDSHAIPANPAKNEGAHFHHDFRFLAVAPESALQAQLAEVHAAEWAPVAKLLQSPDERVRHLFDKLSDAGVLFPDAAHGRRPGSRSRKS